MRHELDYFEVNRVNRFDFPTISIADSTMWFNKASRKLLSSYDSTDRFSVSRDKDTDTYYIAFLPDDSKIRGYKICGEKSTYSTTAHRLLHYFPSLAKGCYRICEDEPLVKNDIDWFPLELIA